MNYEEIIHYIEEIPKFTKKHTLEHTQDFLRRLGNPCRSRKIIHVAGTNGKGSVCAYMQAILLSEGKRVGLFTSPHLERMNERIKIDGIDITDDAFEKVFNHVKCVADTMEEEGIGHPSYFEFLYGMGMMAFEEAGVEYVILETGLGGRLDATNSFAHPCLTVLTSIGMDHTEILGDTLEQIVAEKAGIIKAEVPVFFDGSCPEASVVIRRKAEDVGAPCREIGKDAFEIQEITDKHIAFSICSEYDSNTKWQVGSTGVYQVMNASIAILAMKNLFGDAADTDKWKNAVASTYWPGRMEPVMENVILDGAHNLAAMNRFAESIREQKKNGNLPEGKLVILFSAVSDKDYEHMIRVICRDVDADAYVITKLEDKRGEEAETLAEVFAKYTEKPVWAEESLDEAFERAMEERGENGRLYCLGSLYLIGELKRLIGGRHA
ncbi:MAG: bifunctional folylpolyglutamate synthase/dihydrofolate synthase [Bariatricus sp.]